MFKTAKTIQYKTADGNYFNILVDKLAFSKLRGNKSKCIP